MSRSQIFFSSAASLVPLGFQQVKDTFRREHDGFWQIIDFQKGAHGGNYFFVNLAVHPVGMPLLRSDRLVIPEAPEEYECAIRQRVEQACPEPPFLRFREGLVSYNDLALAEPLAHALSTSAVGWLNSWSNFERLASSPQELPRLLTVVPVLKLKAAAMIRAFACSKLGLRDLARQAMNEYLSAPSAGHSFDKVDEHLDSMLMN